jgi:hypothetical protein
VTELLASGRLRPACGRYEPHHVVHRRDGGPTSLANLKDYCSLMAPPRGAARAGLDADRPPRRHQPGGQPRRQDHPQPQPPTPTQVTLFLVARVPLLSEDREVKLGAPFAFEELVADQAGLLPHAQPPGQPRR